MNIVKQQMPTGELTLKVDEARFPLDWLIGFAARANAKRGFLFLSKVLGKHWPVTPRAMEAIHDDLAAQIPPSLPGPVVFIAMAETAVGLGQGVFEAWLRANPNRQGPVPAQLALSRGQRALLRIRGIAQPRAAPVFTLVGSRPARCFPRRAAWC